MLDYVPASFRVLRHIQSRLVCKGCDTAITAAMPSPPIERGKPSPGLIAHVLTAKYCDHLPLYHQLEIYAREGVDLARSTMADWVGKASALLAPLITALRSHVLAGDRLHGDDTQASSDVDLHDEAILRHTGLIGSRSNRPCPPASPSRDGSKHRILTVIGGDVGGDDAGRHTRVVRCRVQLFVTQEGLDDPDAGAALEQVGGKAVAEGVEGDGFADAGSFDRLLEQPRELPFAQIA